MNTALNEKTSDERTCEFRRIADQVCSVAAKQSLNLLGYHSPELPHYNALPVQKQIEVLHQLKVFLRTMEATVECGDRLDSPGRSVWHALVTLGLRPPSDMFSLFGADDVVEIYDLQGIQTWRNFNFLMICSYTLEEMYSIDWPSRYRRDPDKTAECVQKVGNFLTGGTPDIYRVDISDHIMEETSSEECLVLQTRHDWTARLKDSEGAFVAWIVSSQVKIVGKNASKPRQRPELQLVPSAPQLAL